MSDCAPSLSEKAMATHSSVLAWRIPGTGEPGGLLSMGLHRVGTQLKRLRASQVELAVKQTKKTPKPLCQIHNSTSTNSSTVLQRKMRQNGQRTKIVCL